MNKKNPLYFIDLFAGCGGLSLGFIQAGYKGLFAIEKSEDAFATLKTNLIDRSPGSFDWPSWLPCKNLTTQDLLDGFQKYLKSLKGSVDVIVGGPPCQGFSSAGKRDPNDPRNMMTEQYINLVTLIQPRMIVIENVTGYAKKFKASGSTRLHEKTYADTVIERLEKNGYSVEAGSVCASIFGVPQKRKRFLIVGTKDLGDMHQRISKFNLEDFVEYGPQFRSEKGLSPRSLVSVKHAIEDLKVSGKSLTECLDSAVLGFEQLEYTAPKRVNPYLKLMRSGSKKFFSPDSLRLPKHKVTTRDKFRKIQYLCKDTNRLTRELRESLGIKKHTLTVLNAEGQSPTVTTLPDDILHYDEPRILTVRETARLQSFPDWYSFRGKYTTGGDRRKLECPRYTQVGNAVPPLLAEAIARWLRRKMK